MVSGESKVGKTLLTAELHGGKTTAACTTSKCTFNQFIFVHFEKHMIDPLLGLDF